MQFTLAELATPIEQAFPGVVIVWRNASHAEIRDALTVGGGEPLGVALRNPDFPVAAAACGYCTARPEQSRRGFERALAARLDAERPAFIEMRATDPWLGVSV